MPGFWLLVILAAGLFVVGVSELWLHRRRLARIPIRIHINGTRGKSSVTRLVAAGLRAGGIRTCAKTTGTLARMILPDGRELPVYRPFGARILEQKRIVALAAEQGAEALVLECMALQPELQSLSELKLVSATHGVVTNARPDHLDVMGPGEEHVALALAGMMPRKGRFYTAERKRLGAFADAAKDRKSELVAIDEEAVQAITRDDLAGFAHTEHPDNVALALRICEDLGIDRATALKGMWAAPPDPGALTEHRVDFFGRQLTFINGFAANDPVSTGQLWNMMLKRHPEVERRIAIFNCRVDRADRSHQLADALGEWPAPDHVVLMGDGTYLFARRYSEQGGGDASRLVVVENLTVEAIFERLVSLAGRSALIMGMGNVGGQGLDLVEFFRNRTLPEEVTCL